jgi:cytochrome c553
MPAITGVITGDRPQPLAVALAMAAVAAVPGTAYTAGPAGARGRPAADSAATAARRPADETPSAPLDWRRAVAAAGVREIVFAVRAAGRDEWHYYANFGYEISPDPSFQIPPGQAWRYAGHAGRRFGTVWKYGGKGGRLARMDLRSGKVTALLDDPNGDVRDPCVHYDGRRILLAYRKGGTDQYHLYEIGADGAGLRQLTDGPWDDVEPTYAPDGSIVFASTRARRFVPCWKTPVAILHRCDADGRNIRALSSNVEHDNSPWMLPDGRVVYTRWEYLDRCDMKFHHLWSMYPDGTGQMVFFGNMRPNDVMIDAKPVPPSPASGQAGAGKVLAIFSSGPGEHGKPEHRGAVVVVDPDAGPDEKGAVRYITAPTKPYGDGYRDPFPLSADLFLAVRDQPGGSSLVLLDANGAQETVHTLADRSLLLHEPRPLKPHPREPVLASRTNLANETGVVVLSDVTHGRNMNGVRPGEITKLLVLEQLPKPWNCNAGPDMITFGTHIWGESGTYTLSRILGTVPVQADGSACFEVPALRSLFFVALDANNLAVKRMQSFCTVMPGETAGCVGCHENRQDTLRESRALLATRKPARIEPVAGVPEILDYLRDIQPILDKHCVRCHDGRAEPGKGAAVNLSSQPVEYSKQDPRRYARGYLTLVARKQNDWVAHAWNKDGNRPPRTLGSSGSRLMKLIDGSHYQARPSAREQEFVRLWIDTSATYAGTYAALGGMEGPYHVPTFRPNEHYVREMKRYGVLPATFDLAKDPINVYETDQTYWRSFWHTGGVR